MINELYEKELRNTSINDVSLADYVRENYIPKSVIEDIKKGIRQERKDHPYDEYCDGLLAAEEIIDKHISGKENK